MIYFSSNSECDAETTALSEVGHTTPSLTVIVPVRNEEQHIARTLDQLLAQERQGIDTEVLVVDGRSTDKTCEVVQQYLERHPEVRLLDNPKRLSSAARNIAIEHSRGRFLVVVDGHCELPNRTYFVDLVDAFERSGADCLGRPQPLDITNATTLQRAIAVARSSCLGHHPESFIYSHESQFVPAKSIAVAYRREVFDRVGYFDESFDAHEDGEFNHRCDISGLQCFFAPNIAVKYFPRESLLGLYRQLFRYGRGRVRFSCKHPGTWGLGALIPALFVFYVLLGGILALAFPTLAIPYAAGLGFYAAVVASFSIHITVQERKLSLLLWLPLVFLTIHTGAGVGIITEAITPERLAGFFRGPSVN